MKVGELFAGIGGIGLGLERTGGFEVVWQVEKDDYATKVLEKNWPAVRRWDDVKTFPPETGTWECDLICGGFPCQDISFAGKGAGLEGERSGLFYEGIRIIKTLRPRWVLLENVSALLVRGLGDVLRELAQIGYDSEWHCVPAASVGAPHRRDRIFILAHTQYSGSHGDWQDEQERQCQEVRGDKLTRRDGGNRDVANSNDSGDRASRCNTNEDRSPVIQGREEQSQPEPSRQREVVANTTGIRPSGQGALREPVYTTEEAYRETVKSIPSSFSENWETEPDVGRVVDGVSSELHRSDRLRCLGNAVVPQVAQFMGEIILQRDQELFRKEE
jgi:DNA (cytosine-5)-methyltransferase 1